MSAIQGATGVGPQSIMRQGFWKKASLKPITIAEWRESIPSLGAL